MRKVEKNERRFDRYGEFRLLAAAEGWVLYRRKGAATGAMTIREWDDLPRFAALADMVDAPRFRIVK